MAQPSKPQCSRPIEHRNVQKVGN